MREIRGGAGHNDFGSLWGRIGESMDADKGTRLETLRSFVVDHLEQSATAASVPPHELDYRIKHTMRVARWGQRLAEAEEGDVELAMAACLLHDVAFFDGGLPVDHGRLGASVARPALREIGYQNSDVETICNAVALHVDGEVIADLTAKITTDADNIDRFDAYRLFLWVAEGGVDDFTSLVARCGKRLDTLRKYLKESPMETAQGRKYFAERLSEQVALLSSILRQAEESTAPEEDFR